MATDRAQRAFLDTGMLSRLAAVPLLARRPMIGGVSGRHVSPHRGSSVEFAEYRKYVPGDDLRRLDWRVWGRTDRHYVKEYEADTNLRLCVVLDTSGSMGYGSRAEMARPHHEKVLFAGEATADGSLMGAHGSGLRAAKEALAILGRT